MDQIALVNVEAAKLRDIATAFRQTGLRISGVYLMVYFLKVHVNVLKDIQKLNSKKCIWILSV